MKTTNSICNIWTGWQRNTFIRKENRRRKIVLRITNEYNETKRKKKKKKRNKS